MSLYGQAALQKLLSSHVCVIGLGGVGSWTAESLARSGVGILTLIDPDEVCPSNCNRQLAALDSTRGKTKAGVLAERIRDIHPECVVHVVEEFFLPGNAERLLTPSMSAVVDAVDRMSIKALILDQSRRLHIPAVTMGGSGGKSDPTRIVVDDLGRSGRDELLRQVRRKLRRSHAWEQGEGNTYNVPTIFSPEPPVIPGPHCESSPSPGKNCGSGMGSVAHVTAVFGFLAASEILKILLRDAGSQRHETNSKT